MIKHMKTQREQINEQMNAFIMQGGTITHCAAGERATTDKHINQLLNDDNNNDWSKRVQQHRVNKS